MIVFLYIYSYSSNAKTLRRSENERKYYILTTKEGYTLKTAPFGDISYYEIYEVEKNSE